MSRTTRLTLPMLLALFATQLAACAPTVFDDATALAVVGDPPPLPPPPPPPPPPPEPEPEPPKRVVVEDNKISINEKIQFDLDKATIRPESDGLMAEIISVIKENPHIKKIAIEGHTSSEGTDKHNLKLSDQRAKAVMDYLVKKGELPKEMFTAKGYGETRLIADESTEEGKEKNRRVEFNIVEQDVTKKKVEIDPKTGQKKVVEESTSTLENPSPETPSDGAAAPAPAPEPAKATK
ncbi:OmpA family protein [Nannocystis punicea]|uniref:OmpA family protein n=1 Tax=Nannocystis punicea TaxID=2995304 RepID=A0ABY7HIA8_9BACT|nr:OmpA family protein [Nannocystis poenicansa]WAS98604.1 OmpA family protein [Nannocystis poenicansa]